ncbi:transcription elongation factor GreA [Paenibacillus koleovorans]|uniref:transcription elongation factor GreA n=1 Tax=Paenibacillus koleovorans TaxID=121608 RepID=UPI000FDB0F41|nr:transcription elongation factor GreA [Paenibacillus koleovorans]
MSSEELMVTREGLEAMEQELEELKTVKRKELAERIKLAISYGDLKENSEYHSAKNDQAFMETRILTLTNMLKRTRVVDTSQLRSDIVQVGSSVVLNDIEFSERITYRVVGPSEADVQENKISYESPLGKALLGQKVGSTIKVDAPAGQIEYELLEIK